MEPLLSPASCAPVRPRSWSASPRHRCSATRASVASAAAVACRGLTDPAFSACGSAFSWPGFASRHTRYPHASSGARRARAAAGNRGDPTRGADGTAQPQPTRDLRPDRADACQDASLFESLKHRRVANQFHTPLSQLQKPPLPPPDATSSDSFPVLPTKTAPCGKRGREEFRT